MDEVARRSSTAHASSRAAPVASAIFRRIHRACSGEREEWAPIVSIRAAEDGTLYVATAERGGIYSSSNGGRNWQHIGSSIPSDNFYSMRLSPQGYIVLSTFKEVLLSKDGGLSWSSLRGDGYLKDFLFTRSGTLLGVHWREGFNYALIKNQEEWKRSGGNVDFLITDVVESENKRLWCATFGGGVRVSDDGGRNWSAFGDGPENRSVLSLAWNASAGTLLAGTYEGGGTGVSVTAIEPFRDGVVIGTASGGLFLAEATRSSWRALLPFDPVTGLVELDRGSVLFAATWRNGLLRSRNGGLSWEHVEGNTAIDGIVPSNSVAEEYRYIYALSSDGDRVAIATEQGLSASVDGGETWKNACVNSGLYSVLFDREGTLLGVSKNGVWRCTPEGVNVEEFEIKGFKWSPFNYFTGLFRGSDGALFGVMNNELHRLLPKDGRYKMQGASLANIEVLDMLALPDGGILMGTSKAFYRSDDHGSTWKEIGLP